MAHWFHRNPLKATAPCSFDLKGISTTGTSQKICGYGFAELYLFNISLSMYYRLFRGACKIFLDSKRTYMLIVRNFSKIGPDRQVELIQSIVLLSQLHCKL